MTLHGFKGAGLFGLALLLSASLLSGCGGDPATPAPSTPDEEAAIAKAEAVIEEGRPDKTNEAVETPKD